MKKIYMLGIGGISMSSLAVMLKQRGFDVGGSDEVKSVATNMLNQSGISVDFEPNFKKLEECDCVICSSAIKEDNQQLIFAKNIGKRILTRGQILGTLAKEYENVIAVAGSHGKTTTTAMIYEILKTAGVNPTLHLGGYLIENGKNHVVGGKEFFVVEACEYCDNFLNLFPTISVITNIEKEHLDYFKTFENQLKSFQIFRRQSKDVIEGLGEYRAKYIRHDKNGRLGFTLFQNDKKLMRLNLKMCEEVNVENCIYAYQVAKKLGVQNCVIKQALENFKGVKRRFERVYSDFEGTVIVDYAHHPTEIAKSIKSAKRIFKNKRLVVVFQPHTYSRTSSLLNEFIEVFKDVNSPIFYRTYSAREQPCDGISADEFVKKLKKYNKNAIFFEKYCDLFAFLQKFNNKDSVLLFLGAGDLPDILHKNRFIE